VREKNSSSKVIAVFHRSALWNGVLIRPDSMGVKLNSAGRIQTTGCSCGLSKRPGEFMAFLNANFAAISKRPNIKRV
jgi:hypothetical protein